MSSPEQSRIDASEVLVWAAKVDEEQRAFDRQSKDRRGHSSASKMTMNQSTSPDRRIQTNASKISKSGLASPEASETAKVSRAPPKTSDSPKKHKQRELKRREEKKRQETLAAEFARQLPKKEESCTFDSGCEEQIRIITAKAVLATPEKGGQVCYTASDQATVRPSTDQHQRITPEKTVVPPTDSDEVIRQNQPTSKAQPSPDPLTPPSQPTCPALQQHLSSPLTSDESKTCVRRLKKLISKPMKDWTVEQTMNFVALLPPCAPAEESTALSTAIQDRMNSKEFSGRDLVMMDGHMIHRFVSDAIAHVHESYRQTTECMTELMSKRVVAFRDFFRKVQEDPADYDQFDDKHVLARIESHANEAECFAAVRLEPLWSDPRLKL